MSRKNKQSIYLNAHRAFIIEPMPCNGLFSTWVFDVNKDGSLTPGHSEIHHKSTLKELLMRFNAKPINKQLKLA
jgi:hypothetical protein